MIKEDYVSFETAKLLKEKGFESDECIAIYDLGDNNAFVRDSAIFENGPEDYLEFQWGEEWRRFGYYLAPTLQMALKWLREVHDIHLSITPFDIEPRFSGRIVRYIPEIYTLPSKGHEMDCVGMNVCNSYEEAANAAILYALKNLIDF